MVSDYWYCGDIDDTGVFHRNNGYSTVVCIAGPDTLFIDKAQMRKNCATGCLTSKTWGATGGNGYCLSKPSISYSALDWFSIRSNMGGSTNVKYVRAYGSTDSVCKNGGQVVLSSSAYNNNNPSSLFKWKLHPQGDNTYRISLKDYCSGWGEYYISPSNFNCDKGTKLLLKPWGSTNAERNKQKWVVEVRRKMFSCSLTFVGCSEFLSNARFLPRLFRIWVQGSGFVITAARKTFLMSRGTWL